MLGIVGHFLSGKKGKGRWKGRKKEGKKERKERERKGREGGREGKQRKEERKEGCKGCEEGGKREKGRGGRRGRTKEQVCSCLAGQMHQDLAVLGFTCLSHRVCQHISSFLL